MERLFGNVFNNLGRIPILIFLKFKPDYETTPSELAPNFYVLFAPSPKYFVTLLSCYVVFI